MRSVSGGMASHIAGEVTTLATLWRVTLRDGAIFTLTNHSHDIVYGGETYQAAIGYKRSAIGSGSDLAVDEAELEALLTADTIVEQELRAGRWDGATVRIFAVNYRNTALGEIKFRKGTLGEVIIRDDGTYFAELRGLTQPLQSTVGELYIPTCRADLGDARCKIPLRPPARQDLTAYAVGDFVRIDFNGPTGGSNTAYDEAGVIFECTVAGTSGTTLAPFSSTPGDVTVDGSVTWVTRTAWSRPATIASVTDSVTLVLDNDGIGSFAADYFENGVAVWETGENNFAAREILAWDPASRTLSLLGPPPFVPEEGDILRLQPGCDKLWAGHCASRFNNRLNFRGFPDISGLPGLITNSP